MTKLKCWKNIRSTNVFKRWTKNNNVIEVYPHLIRKRGWIVYRVINSKPFSAEFKTNPQALKFANKYMKEHDKC